jgi:hypothetical protein
VLKTKKQQTKISRSNLFCTTATGFPTLTQTKILAKFAENQAKCSKNANLTSKSSKNSTSLPSDFIVIQSPFLALNLLASSPTSRNIN